jgi:hypothetical protein
MSVREQEHAAAKGPATDLNLDDVIAVTYLLRLLLDEQADQLFAMTDVIAERARKLGGSALRSIGDISRHQRLRDNNEANVAPSEMLGA